MVRILSKALKAKLSKYPQWSCQSVNASQLENVSTTYHSNAYALSRMHVVRGVCVPWVCD